MSTLVLIFRQPGRFHTPTAAIPTVVITEKPNQTYEVVTKKSSGHEAGRGLYGTDGRPGAAGTEVVRLIISDVNTLLMYINVLASTIPFWRIDVCAKDVFLERTSVYNNPRGSSLLSQCVYIWSLTTTSTSTSSTTIGQAKPDETDDA